MEPAPRSAGLLARLTTVRGNAVSGDDSGWEASPSASARQAAVQRASSRLNAEILHCRLVLNNNNYFSFVNISKFITPASRTVQSCTPNR